VGDVPDQDNVSQMVRRVRKLFRSISVQRALVSPFANRQQIFLQLQLRVVREYNLPDSFSAVLQRSMDTGGMLSGQGVVGGVGVGDTPDQQEAMDNPYGRYSAGSGEWRLPGGSFHYSGGWDQAVGGIIVPDQPLSDIMPDIALAGAVASFSGLSMSRSVPSPRPPSPQGALSPDLVVDQVEVRWSPRSSGARSVPHSYRHGPSHMFL